MKCREKRNNISLFTPLSETLLLNEDPTEIYTHAHTCTHTCATPHGRSRYLLNSDNAFSVRKGLYYENNFLKNILLYTM